MKKYLIFTLFFGACTPNPSTPVEIQIVEEVAINAYRAGWHNGFNACKQDKSLQSAFYLDSLWFDRQIRTPLRTK